MVEVDTWKAILLVKLKWITTVKLRQECVVVNGDVGMMMTEVDYFWKWNSFSNLAINKLLENETIACWNANSVGGCISGFVLAAVLCHRSWAIPEMNTAFKDRIKTSKKVHKRALSMH